MTGWSISLSTSCTWAVGIFESFPRSNAKKVLEKLLGKEISGIHYSEHETKNAKRLFADACKMNSRG